jgi:choline dehydrogenase
LPTCGLGADLQDHLQVRMQYRCPAHHHKRRDQQFPPSGRSWLRYALFRKGCSPSARAMPGISRTSPAVATPDVQVHFIIFSTDKVGAALHPFPGFIASVCQLRRRAAASCASVGRSEGTAGDPAALPVEW